MEDEVPSRADSSIEELIAQLEAYSAHFSVATSSSSADDDSRSREAALQLAEELVALQSIYSDQALRLLKIETEKHAEGSDTRTNSLSWLPGSTLKLAISIELESGFGPIPIRLAATLPPNYPHCTHPPLMQLTSRYIGDFSVDSDLCDEVSRTFCSQSFDDDAGTPTEGRIDSTFATADGNVVQWVSGEVALFEGVELIKEVISGWWTSQETSRLEGGGDTSTRPGELVPRQKTDLPAPTIEARSRTQEAATPFTGTLWITDPIIDRKSEFVGYAASISSPEDVPAVLSRIMSDKRVARAAHPIINAWVCRAGSESNIVHRDCDDNGETAAGGRLAHLLSILELENVLIAVSRWFGGIHLGPDRFKLINRAARQALDLGGFVGKNQSQIGAKTSTKRRD